VSSLFSPTRLGPLTLRNRTIRSAAFEGMCPGGSPSEELLSYHRSVAAGGIGMTTVAYAAVLEAGRTFTHQLWMRPEVVPGLRSLTEAVHREGAAACIQLGHAGYMSDKKLAGGRAHAPSAVFNLFGLAYPRAMTQGDIAAHVEAFARSTALAQEAGFDAVELQAGHGYLVSQFLTRLTNRRHDEFGGELAARARFLRDVMRAVRAEAGSRMAVLVKMNVDDGFPGGNGIDEARSIAKLLEDEGADALVLSGGFVSKCPFYMLRGELPLRELLRTQPLVNRIGLTLFRRLVVKTYEFRPAFFLEPALAIRPEVRVPLVLVGGINSLATMEQAVGAGIDFVAMARALIREPDFVNRLARGQATESRCHPCNKCVAYMYAGRAWCPETED
jgi:2,4-dienoyl-CoA reductase-like NADH-dependent reductase (Old Yellow Enzyme family)